ncbi:MAG TPA: thioredoxin [Methylomirabilota bacterium]|nr:thioredoxin [Methylomirabilota bacterium]
MAEVRCPACGTLNRIPQGRMADRGRCGKCKAELPAAAAGPVPVTDATFDRLVLGASTPVLLDLWAEWCGPCHMVAPTIDALARDYAGRVLVGKLDIDANPTVARQFDVRSIPTLLLFREGKLVDRLVGVQPRAAIEARLRELLTSGSAAASH